MAPTDLATTNLWLALIAIASLIQSALIVTLVVTALRFYRRTESKMDEIKHDVLLPMQARTGKVMDEMEDVMARVRAVDDRVSDAIHRANAGLDLVATTVRRRVWPVVGLVRGVRAAWGALSDKRRRTTALAKLSEDETQRINYEGGTGYARTSRAR